MHHTLATLIDLLDTRHLGNTAVIPWGCPVPAFGKPISSRVATLGLNPSNREFMDSLGNELVGRYRRFHTLASLGLRSWGEADARHIQEIILYCEEYFHRNPYDRWFRVLDGILTGSGVSYYNDGDACHLDLIPYATSVKWGRLTLAQRALLLSVGGMTLSGLLASSQICALVLNGRAVVSHFEHSFGVALGSTEMPEWSLPRQSGFCVPGFAYWGSFNELCGRSLDRDIAVLGFNHNLQSSFGVNKWRTGAIREWVSDSLAEVLS